MKWLGEDDADMREQLTGPALSLASPQTGIAPPLLEEIRELLTADMHSVQLVKQHDRLSPEQIARRECAFPDDPCNDFCEER